MSPTNKCLCQVCHGRWHDHRSCPKYSVRARWPRGRITQFMTHMTHMTQDFISLLRPSEAKTTVESPRRQLAIGAEAVSWCVRFSSHRAGEDFMLCRKELQRRPKWREELDRPHSNDTMGRSSCTCWIASDTGYGQNVLHHPQEPATVDDGCGAWTRSSDETLQSSDAWQGSI